MRLLLSLLRPLLKRLGGFPGEAVLQAVASSAVLVDQPPDTAAERDLSVRGLHRSAFRPDHLAYCAVINPKAACSSLKHALWTTAYRNGLTVHRPPGVKSKGGVHRQTANPLTLIPRTATLDGLRDGPLVTVVRNPYTRLLSAYLDKVDRDSREKRSLLWALGEDENRAISFPEFLDIICRADSRELDAHWTPQSYLTQARHLRYDFVGAVENLGQDLARIVTLIFGERPAEMPAAYRPHATSATEKVARYYTPDLADMVRTRYAEDFAVFGYDPDPGKADQPPVPSGLVGSLAPEGCRLSPALERLVGISDRLRGRDFAGVLTLAAAALADTPSLPPEAHLLVGEAYATWGLHADALPHAQAAARGLDGDSRAWVALVRALLRGGQAEAALAASTRAMAVAPGRPLVLSLHADALAAVGRKAEAGVVRARAPLMAAMTLHPIKAEDSRPAG